METTLENSVNFELVLKSPPSQTDPSQLDFFAKLVFALCAWLGGEGPRAHYEPHNVMHVTDHEWERCAFLTLALHALELPRPLFVE